MHIQNQIKRTLSEPDSIKYIRDLLDNNEVEHRTELAKRACEKFTFFDTRGQAQIGGYLGRTNDIPPGHQILWHGDASLQHRCVGFSLLESGLCGYNFVVLGGKSKTRGLLFQR